MSGEIGLHATPTVAGNVVVVGAAHRSGGVPTGKTNVKGYIRGFDVRTGKRLWIFHTIPQPGEFGNDTWLKDSWAYTGNTGAWGQISVDPELQIAYLPVESATGDYFGADRPGNNLFAESLVAVDLQTGKRKWHYQLVHHGIWDHDIPCAPILVDIRRDGKIIKAVAQPTKQAFMYVFDRVTGQPLWPIEERPVPKGDVPGEYYSPTQPFPLNGRGQPFNYDSQGFVVDDLIDFTPELRAEGMKVISRYKVRPDLHTAGRQQSRGPACDVDARIGRRRDELAGRLVRSGDEHSLCELAEIGQPARAGAAARSVEERSRLRHRQRIDRRENDGRDGIGSGRRSRGRARNACSRARQRCACGRRRWRRSRAERAGAADHEAAVRAVVGDRSRQGRSDLAGRAWRDAGRDSESCRPEGAEHSAHRAARCRRIDDDEDARGFGRGGIRPTPTGARGAMLRAYDKATGKEVGAVYLPAPQTGSPMTYTLNGRQYIVVAVSGAGYSGELIAFRLPS